MSEELPDLATQFRLTIQPRLDRVSQAVAGEVANIFEKQMKQNTMDGRGFGNDEYNSTYSESHRRARKRKGVQTGRVDLRYDKRRIEQTRIETTSGKKASATIRFADGGEIFKMHHTGRAKGGKIRSIWPKTPRSVPDSIKDQIKGMVGEVLRGKK